MVRLIRWKKGGIALNFPISGRKGKLSTLYVPLQNALRGLYLIKVSPISWPAIQNHRNYNLNYIYLYTVIIIYVVCTLFCSYRHSFPPINCRITIYNLVLLIPSKFSIVNCRKFYSGSNFTLYNCRRQIMFDSFLFIQFHLQTVTKNSILFYSYFYTWKLWKTRKFSFDLIYTTVNTCKLWKRRKVSFGHLYCLHL